MICLKKNLKPTWRWATNLDTVAGIISVIHGGLEDGGTFFLTFSAVILPVIRIGVLCAEDISHGGI